AQAIDVVAEISVRQVPLEDLVLAQPGLEPQRNQRLARLAAEVLLGVEERELGELLRDRAAALGAATGQVRPRRAGDAPRVDAPVAVEAAVLDGQEGVDDVRRQLLYLDRRIDNGAVSRDRRAVGSEQSELRRHHRL